MIEVKCGRVFLWLLYACVVGTSTSSNSFFVMYELVTFAYHYTENSICNLRSIL